jgi:hypothetical protein
MASKYHPTPLSGGDRKALAKELGKARAMANILATQSAETRAKGAALIQQADKLLCESWNERMWSDGESVSQPPLKDQAFSTFLDQNPPFELPPVQRSRTMGSSAGNPSQSGAITGTKECGSVDWRCATAAERTQGYESTRSRKLATSPGTAFARGDRGGGLSNDRHRRHASSRRF